MEIKKTLSELVKPEKYGPYLLGGAAGVIGGGVALTWLQQQLAAQGDLGDWGARLGFTAGAVVAMAAVGAPSGGEGRSDMVKKALWTAALSAGIVGTISILTKVGIIGTGVAVGRVGASPVARGGMSVVKPTTPTYAQARPVVGAVGEPELIRGF